MRKYFFGYLFVRLAKLIAGAAFLIAICYGLFKIAQGSNAAESVRYQRSAPLQQHLSKLSEQFTESGRLLSEFGAQFNVSIPKEAPPTFDANIDSNSDFDRLADELNRTDKEIHAMKQALVAPFEMVVSRLEQRLREHAAAVAPTVSTPLVTSAPPTPVASPTPVPIEKPTLFSPDLAQGEVEMRSSELEKGRDLLKVIQSTAENETNKKDLAESIVQLEALSKLLPERRQIADDAPSSQTTGSQPSTFQQPRELLNAERVAMRLADLRGAVRRAILSSWSLDYAFQRASELASAEKKNCRVSTLAVKGVWLSTFGQIGSAIIAGAFMSFLILVMADLTQTLLDTATNTGVMAEAPRPGPDRRDKGSS